MGTHQYREMFLIIRKTPIIFILLNFVIRRIKSEIGSIEHLKTCRGETLPGPIYKVTVPMGAHQAEPVYFFDPKMKKSFGEARIYCETRLMMEGNLWCPESQSSYDCVN